MKIIELFQHVNIELKQSFKWKIAAFTILIVAMACVLYVSIRDIVVYLNHDPHNPNSTLPPIPQGCMDKSIITIIIYSLDGYDDIRFIYSDAHTSMDMLMNQRIQLYVCAFGYELSDEIFLPLSKLHHAECLSNVNRFTMIMNSLDGNNEFRLYYFYVHTTNGYVDESTYPIIYLNRLKKSGFLAHVTLNAGIRFIYSNVHTSKDMLMNQCIQSSVCVFGYEEILLPFSNLHHEGCLLNVNRFTVFMNSLGGNNHILFIYSDQNFFRDARRNQSFMCLSDLNRLKKSCFLTLVILNAS
ncbi:hypothetical protein HNY73_016347 [Argiope bruennichi]|uniref:Uncharacterized protein n=1 Tax=Argiope bruennichi TaxID=94029 RepID=A0A8T0EI62_ARGBR|nr:hypothetical protein HNY73_016347 [Argiope bruennichi]